ncbi:MAG: bifunctional molybdopterin-guanine dinucleotide biosynthesis adaptor protein MobB/molybdopterin molybdotransferase MoeA [Amphritea sp.]
MRETLANDCTASPSATMLSIEEGLARILDTVHPLDDSEMVDIDLAQGRTLAAALISPIDVPAHNNSAMDGYAVRGAELSPEGETCLQVVANVLAGHPFSGTLGPGECVQIMTGAQIPEGLDTIVIKEICCRAGEMVCFPAGVRTGQHLRLAGEDLRKGQEALSAGTGLGAAELGLIASLGLAEVEVLRKPRVAYFSTGDEIRRPGEAIQAGQIYDSNQYTVTAMLRDLGVEVIELGVIPDRREALEEAFQQACSQADVIISSGGVSIGDADYVKETLDQLGEVNFWRMAIKPGRPLAFGRVEDALFFGLPGNPVAVMITFLQFVKPALKKLLGDSHWQPQQFQLPCRQSLKSQAGRSEFLRGIIEADAEGRLAVHTTGQQGSGILTSMSRADCLIVLGPECSGVEVGKPVWVQPLKGLLSR